MSRKDPEARKEYHRNYLRERYRNDPEYRAKHRSRTDVNDAKYRIERVELIANFRKDGCKFCGEKEACCLDAHHIDPSQKSFSVANANSHKKSPSKTAEELSKCICVCANCHRKLHAGILEL